VPSFCRHNRFIERCPICSKTLPGLPERKPPPRARPRRASAERARPRRAASGASSGAQTARRGPAEALSVRREQRAVDDGYRSELLPGLRASADARRLAVEIGFSGGRLQALASCPPDLYGEIKALAEEDLEQATWACMLTAYLCPLEGEMPFAGIRLALGEERGTLEDLAQIPLGPRTCHDRARGPQTLLAYRRWIAQASSAGRAFSGDPGWSSRRRFERLFERLALPGFARRGRYELLVLLGRLGLYELEADSLHLIGGRGPSASDPATVAAKRVFAIGDALHLERRSTALAEAVSVPIETLDLALANWGAEERATLGFPPETVDRQALARAHEALGL
jgi:Alpha-glutamyl/putrescinyl thymine pyrophosphorylase clade 3